MTESQSGVAPPEGRRRWRLAVAVVFNPPVSDEIDGIRAALGDRRRARIVPHITLVPPVNLAAAEFPAALAVVRAAAAQSAPTRLALGGLGTFAPRTPVVFLEVGGDLDRLRRLRDGLVVPPLGRPDPHPFVPHVTVCDMEADEVATAQRLVGHYSAVADLDRVVVLSHDERVWRPVADVALGKVATVGRGGLPLELTESRILDPEAVSVLGLAGAPSFAGAFAGEGAAGLPGGAGSSGGVPPGGAGAGRRVVITARREGSVVGAAWAWTDDDGGHASALVAPHHRGEGIGRHLLAALESAVARQGWGSSHLAPTAPTGW